MLRPAAGTKWLLWLFGATLFTLLVAVPMLVLLLAALSGSWTGVLPSSYTFQNLHQALSGENLQSVSVSLQTAVLASAGAVAIGTWAALAARRCTPRMARLVDTAFHLPLAVPSVVVGLGALVAFSHRPLLLNGTAAIVILVQLTLVLSFAYSIVDAAVARLDPMQAQVAASLGASPARVLLRVQLPALLPSIGAAAALALSLCMGELGATIMVYPATWRTLPVTVFALSDRGALSAAAAGTALLVTVSVAALAVVARLRRRGMAR